MYERTPALGFPAALFVLVGLFAAATFALKIKFTSSKIGAG